MASDKQGKKPPNIADLLNGIIEGKVNANRRYIDEVLEQIQDKTHRYYLDRLAIEVARMELEERAGNTQRAYHHKVMAGVYKDLLEKAFGTAE